MIVSSLEIKAANEINSTEVDRYLGRKDIEDMKAWKDEKREKASVAGQLKPF